MSQYGDGESADVYTDEWRKARKEHWCHACAEAIVPGQRYMRVAMLFEGRWEIIVRCERCESIHAHLRGRIRKGGDPEEYCDDRLNCGHDYRERWSEDPPPEIAKLAFWMPGEPI